MKPSKKVVKATKEKYPNRELYYDAEDGVIWSIYDNGAIRYDHVEDKWYTSCLTPFWCTSYCKKIK